MQTNMFKPTHNLRIQDYHRYDMACAHCSARIATNNKETWANGSVIVSRNEDDWHLTVISDHVTVLETETETFIPGAWLTKVINSMD